MQQQPPPVSRTPTPKSDAFFAVPVSFIANNNSSNGNSSDNAPEAAPNNNNGKSLSTSREPQQVPQLQPNGQPRGAAVHPLQIATPVAERLTADIVTSMMASLSPSGDIAATQLADTTNKSTSASVPAPIEPTHLIIGNIVPVAAAPSASPSDDRASAENATLSPDSAASYDTSSSAQSSPDSAPAESPTSPHGPADNGFWLFNKIIGFSKHFQPFNAEGATDPTVASKGPLSGRHALSSKKLGTLTSKARWSADNIAVSATEPVPRGSMMANRQPVKSILKKRFVDNVVTGGGSGDNSAAQSRDNLPAAAGSHNSSAGDISSQQIAADTDGGTTVGKQVAEPSSSDSDVAQQTGGANGGASTAGTTPEPMTLAAKHRLMYGTAQHSSAPDLTSLMLMRGGGGGAANNSSSSSLASSKSGSTKRLAFAEDVGASNARVVVQTHSKTTYNRKPDSNITFRRLTPQLKMEIREELNKFKRTEMVVHQDSARNTAFH